MSRPTIFVFRIVPSLLRNLNKPPQLPLQQISLLSPIPLPLSIQPMLKLLPHSAPLSRCAPPRRRSLHPPPLLFLLLLNLLFPPAASPSLPSTMPEVSQAPSTPFLFAPATHSPAPPVFFLGPCRARSKLRRS